MPPNIGELLTDRSLAQDDGCKAQSGFFCIFVQSAFVTLMFFYLLKPYKLISRLTAPCIRGVKLTVFTFELLRRDLFYPKGVKIVPTNIGDILTARSLAFWSMDDGSKARAAFLLCTESFTLESVQLLVKTREL